MEQVKELRPFAVDGKESVCRVEILSLEGERHAVICEEVDDNPGPSVSQSWEAVVEKVQMKYGLKPSNVVWIEHNSARLQVTGRTLDRWQLVTFKLPATAGTIATDPDWRNMTRDDWIELGLPPRD